MYKIKRRLDMNKQVRVVGLGVMEGDETCTYCGRNTATIYVSEDNIEMIPACNKCIGPGSIGNMAEVLYKSPAITA